MKVLFIDKIAIDSKMNRSIYLEIHVSALNYSGSTLTGIEKNFGVMTKQVQDLTPLELGHMSDDGVIDVMELMILVQMAAMQWVAEHFGATIVDNQIILEE